MKVISRDIKLKGVKMEGDFFGIFTSDIFERESTSQPTVNIEEETIENSEVVKVFDAGTDAMCDVES